MAACASGSIVIIACLSTGRHGSIPGFRTGFHPGKDSPESPRRGINYRGGLLILFTQPQADRQGVAQGLALLGGFELVVLADGAEDGLVGAELLEAGQDLLAKRVGRSRARSPETRASCDRAKIASLVSRPGAYGRSSRTSIQRSTASRRTTVLARPYSGTRAPSRPRHQRT